MIRVASYCRVSTDGEDQRCSFDSQQRYFQEYIDRRPDWEFYQTYADEGTTGTSTKKRTAFNRMLADARLGRFQLILTKEVSRFSRNILDTIFYTRELRQLGVGVLFMNDGIYTLDPDAELRLSIMGSIAQEESRRISDRVKWGQTRQMERGVVFGTSLLGYDVKDGTLTVNPEGAEIVRQIFHKYAIEKKGAAAIARELQEAGCRTCAGNSRWSGSHIIKILKNEKYVGDLVQKKTFTPDYLTHAKKYNHGEEEKIVLHGHHEPIVDRELWEAAQLELRRRNRRNPQGGGHANRYLFSGKIRCGECGGTFVSRKRYRSDGTSSRRWGCAAAVAAGRRRLDAQGGAVGCDVGMLLRDELALDILKQTLGALPLDREALIQSVTQIALEAVRTEWGSAPGGAGELAEQVRRLARKREDVLDAFFSKRITEEDCERMLSRCDREMEALRARRERAERGAEASGALEEELLRRVAAILDGGTSSEAFYRNMLDHMAVYRDRRVEVYLHLLPRRWTFQLERIPRP